MIGYFSHDVPGQQSSSWITRTTGPDGKSSYLCEISQQNARHQTLLHNDIPDVPGRHLLGILVRFFQLMWPRMTPLLQNDRFGTTGRHVLGWHIWGMDPGKYRINQSQIMSSWNMSSWMCHPGTWIKPAKSQIPRRCHPECRPGCNFDSKSTYSDVLKSKIIVAKGSALEFKKSENSTRNLRTRVRKYYHKTYARC